VLQTWLTGHPALLVQAQVPETHVCPAVHACPHDPQLPLSVFELTHAPPQNRPPDGHWHAPLTQVRVAVHAFPQAPQLFESVCSLTHVLQAVSPLGQTQLAP
jgi:hypothetical protein